MARCLEVTNFDLNLDSEGKFHIHRDECFVMFSENRSGLAKIIRALKPYHHNKRQYGDHSDSFVGSSHEICIVLEKLQGLRFELL